MSKETNPSGKRDLLILAYLRYSYGACADRFSSVTAVQDTSYAVANWAQYNADTCPYTVSAAQTTAPGRAGTVILALCLGAVSAVAY
jgi:hypothetical protein